MSKRGIDVSEHQGSINWDAVKTAGIEFAMIRAGYGDNNIDPYFHRNAKACNDRGIPMGVYWFSYAYTADMARREAQYCAAAAEGYEISYPLCYDLEADTVRYAANNGVTIGRTLASDMAEAFCSRVEELGYQAMNYANQDYTRNMFRDELRSKYGFWYARYANLSQPDYECHIWQYTDSGRVNGVSGNVDMNIQYKEFEGSNSGSGNGSSGGSGSGSEGGSGDGASGGSEGGTSGGGSSPVTGDAQIRTIQNWLNNNYSAGLIVDGYYGPRTKSGLIRGFQTELNGQFSRGLAVDGIWGPRTRAASIIVRPGARGNITYLLQAALYCSGYSLAVDGIYGSKTEAQVRRFQRDRGLSQDGIAGPDTFEALLG